MIVRFRISRRTRIAQSYRIERKGCRRFATQGDCRIEGATKEMTRRNNPSLHAFMLRNLVAPRNSLFCALKIDPYIEKRRDESST
jgi:hypothetical protein